MNREITKELTASSPWAQACQAAALFAVDPRLGGVVLRSCAGPARDAWLALLRELLPDDAPMRRVPANVSDDSLLGGLDLTATLRAGRPILAKGLLAQADGGVLLLAMAERMPKPMAARIASAMDDGKMRVERDGFAPYGHARFGVIALDEGQGAEERTAESLRDHLAFQIDLNLLSYRDVGESFWTAGQIKSARQKLVSMRVEDDVIEALVTVAATLGIGSFRAPLLALRVAYAACALRGGETVNRDDVAIAASLVLAPRAVTIPVAEAPQDADSESPHAKEPEAEDEERDTRPDSDAISQNDGELQDLQDLNEVVLAAVTAAIPSGLLELMDAKASRGPKAERSGTSETKATSARRGRPTAARCGQLREGRLSLIDTLRAAAPWQGLRQKSEAMHGRRVIVRPDDFRIVRYRERRETTAIFVVDASGSSAMQRLGEVKGAIELLLADCYVRRDSVAMVAFRGIQAEIVLPPTRSLARAKRMLAGLPGGGGTPLASGLDTALTLADSLGRKGQSPLLVLMTDGRANIQSDGKSGRTEAFQDALRAGERIFAAGIPALAIDTSPRLKALGEPPTLQLGRAMNARYLPLPIADAARVSEAVRAASLGA